MRGVPLTAMIAAGLCMAASAPIMTVNRNEAGTVTGSRYVTFFVLQGNSSGSTMVDRQLKADIETELTGKGLLAASPEEAQAVVVVHTATPAKHLPQCLLPTSNGLTDGQCRLLAVFDLRPGGVIHV